MTKNLYMEKIGKKAKIASLNLSNLSVDKRNSVLKQFSLYLKTNEKLILNENKKDISNAKSKKIKDSMIDRLKLNSKKIVQIRNAIKKINGTFEKGDHILVKDQNNIECARGLTSFSSIEIEKIKGSHSSEIKNILGYSSREEIIHKDDLVKV